VRRGTAGQVSEEEEGQVALGDVVEVERVRDVEEGGQSLTVPE